MMSPSRAKIMYERASCSSDTEMPWPNAMLACSIGRHDLYGRTRPATAPGKPNFGCWPKPDLVNISHISCGGIGSAILAMPMLDDFWMICDTVSTPFGCDVADACGRR